MNKNEIAALAAEALAAQKAAYLEEFPTEARAIGEAIVAEWAWTGRWVNFGSAEGDEVWVQLNMSDSVGFTGWVAESAAGWVVYESLDEISGGSEED